MFKKPLGMWANFAFDCPRCQEEATVTNGRPDYHQCEDRPHTLDDIKF